ncbi:hypothetical protein HBH92_217930 [Parastagonospora nodorum]|nr:hypothetical protein HBH92_217930 [Parastagonospora nodorum]KAH4408933.1 hypothetical protein HBH93_225680 [Parastagonospora nodorum]KAH4430952.1 hypothetical protein HBH91_232680 [Parastagonospora nodorum]KAH4500033.1 hypothetical protein HBH89_118670 [Parastagonospora nodorum]KAH4526005.1 hypothetical protein HBH85_219460 [Parastagonospora nodorum]
MTVPSNGTRRSTPGREYLIPFYTAFHVVTYMLFFSGAEGFDLDSRMHRGKETEYIQSSLQGSRKVVSRTEILKKHERERRG